MAKARGVVAAGHRITAEAAAEILEDGGSAFDAVIAGLFAACVAEVVFASPGGGGFVMAHHRARKRTRAYDFFTQTPRAKRPEAEIDFHAIDANFGPAIQEFYIGAGSTATPGFVPGVFALHTDLGRVPMKRLVEPAVRAAREGVLLSDFQAYLNTIVAPILTATPAAQALFAPDGNLLAAGNIYRNAAFAETLEWLAEDGPRLFTDGDIGSAIVAQSEADGGQITPDDLKGYAVERREPLAWTHRDARLSLNPAPAASGPLIAFGLALIAKLVKQGETPAPLQLARVMAATNDARTAAARNLDTLTGGATIAKHLAALGRHPSASRGTTHISVIDADGNAAAATISNGEGNGAMVGAHGFMLNNMLGEEDLNCDGFHRWRPDTRMSSMMAPTLVQTRGGGMVALGSGGSNRIRTAILQVLVHLIDGRTDLEAAIEAPRIHVEKGGAVSFEDRFRDDDRAALLAAYPEASVWPEPSLFFGGVHTARRHADGRLEGMGDIRRRGVAVVAGRGAEV